MPGQFSGGPIHGLKPRKPSVQNLGARFAQSQNTKRTDQRGESSSESGSEWETRSSDQESFNVDSVDGDYGYIKPGDRGRSKRSSRTKKSRGHRSQSRVRVRSVSKPRHSSRHRRGSDRTEQPGSRRHSPSSSNVGSPYHSSGDERVHGNRKQRKHRSPTRSHNKKNRDKSGLPRSRGSSRDSGDSRSSRDSRGSRHSRGRRGSDATSSAAYSTQSADSQRRVHGHSRTRSYQDHRHGSTTLPNYERFPRQQYHPSSTIHTPLYNDPIPRDYNRADDYPYGSSPPRELAYDAGINGRPNLPHRRNTTQGGYVPNPMAANPRRSADGSYFGIPLHQTHDPRYAHLDERSYGYPSEQARYAPGTSPFEKERFAEFAGALYEAINKKDEQRAGERPHVPLRRAATDMRTGGDGWEQGRDQRGYADMRGAGYRRY
jgi:hypothetical protein